MAMYRCGVAGVEIPTNVVIDVVYSGNEIIRVINKTTGEVYWEK